MIDERLIQFANTYTPKTKEIHKKRFLKQMRYACGDGDDCFFTPYGITLAHVRLFDYLFAIITGLVYPTDVIPIALDTIHLREVGVDDIISRMRHAIHDNSINLSDTMLVHGQLFQIILPMINFNTFHMIWASSSGDYDITTMQWKDYQEQFKMESVLTAAWEGVHGIRTEQLLAEIENTSDPDDVDLYGDDGDGCVYDFRKISCNWHTHSDNIAYTMYNTKVSNRTNEARGLWSSTNYWCTGYEAIESLRRHGFNTFCGQFYLTDIAHDMGWDA